MMMTIICHFNSNDPHSRRAANIIVFNNNRTGEMGIMDMDDRNDETSIQEQLQGEDDIDPELILSSLYLSVQGKQGIEQADKNCYSTLEIHPLHAITS